MAFKQATERDFRKPGLEDARPEDYEVLDSGRLVKKDRFEHLAVHVAALLRNQYMAVASETSDDLVDIDAVLTSLKTVVDANRELLTISRGMPAVVFPSTTKKRLGKDELIELWHEMEKEHSSGFRYEIPVVQFADALLKKTEELNSN